MQEQHRFILKALFATAVLTMVGCAAPSSPLEERKKLEPQFPPGANFALLVGEQSSGLLNPRVYILSIDGLQVSDSENTATKPIRITPGTHTIEIAQRAGGFFATVSFRLELRAQTLYRARAQQEQDVAWYRQQIYSAGGPTQFWIEEESTGTPVTEKQKIMVTGPSRTPYIPVVPSKK